MSQMKQFISNIEPIPDQVYTELLNNITEITEKKNTLEELYDIQTKNPPSISYLPHADKIYDIDLNTRQINAPKFLSIQRDHKSEVIYFRVNRYFDHMDLATTICIIQYITPNDESRIPHIYIVPFFDVMSDFKLKDITETSRDENYISGKWNPTMIFPWCIGGAATEMSGTIEYSIRFYKINKENNKLTLVYNLNTLPAKSEILYGLEVDDEAMKAEYDIPTKQYEELIAQLLASKTFWTIIE